MENTQITEEQSREEVKEVVKRIKFLNEIGSKKGFSLAEAFGYVAHPEILTYILFSVNTARKTYSKILKNTDELAILVALQIGYEIGRLRAEKK